MDGINPQLLAILTGFVFGFFLSVPVGPINLTIVNEGAQHGLKWALMIGFGAVAMEVIYCALAFTGFASFFSGKTIKGILEIFTCGFFLYLGLKFLLMRTIPKTGLMESRLNKRLHPHSAFGIGFVRVMGNPGVFLFWIFLAAAFRSHDLVPTNLTGSILCVLGVAGGTGAWFCGLSWAVSRGYGKFTETTLLRMERGSGICLLLVGLGEGVHIVWQIVHHTL